MRLIRLLLPIAFGMHFIVAAPISTRAEEPAESAAASYIRTLFDATLHDGHDLSDRCPDVEAFGRFAAGRLWHDLPDSERARFNRDFCVLASDAVNRLQAAFPGLSLTITTSQEAPQGMISVQGVVSVPGGQHWPISWLIAGPPGHPHLADLRILGISLGIFLRGLATAEGPEKAPESHNSAEILDPWQRALDRALPRAGSTPPR
jgi:hypothetical protein